MIVYSALATSLLAGCVSEKEEDDANQAQKAKLMPQAKVSKEDAQKTALANVPNGTIKDGELEKEHGRLIWSFDIATPDSKDVTEVNVNAITGEVVSNQKDAPEDQAKERKEDNN